MTTAVRPAGRSTSLGASVRQVDWEQVGADTRYLSHDIHRYSGKFIPQIARSAIELLTAEGDLVVDPYAGSGTTVLEAGLAGRRARGFDLNPIAVWIARAKTTRISRPRLDEMADYLGAVASTLGDPKGPLLDLAEVDLLRREARQDPRRKDPWFRKWFEPEILLDLLVFDQAVERLEAEDQRLLARVVLSDVLRRSSRAHGGYPNVMFDKHAGPRSRPGPLLRAGLRRCVGAISALPQLAQTETEVGDARRLPIDDCTADAVVTHPPYIGSIPYAEYGSVSLRWFGEDPRVLDAKMTGGRRQSRDVVERFRSAYLESILEMHRVVRPEGHAFLMVGKPKVKGEIIDLPGMTKDLAAGAGFELVAETARQGSNRRANKMGVEVLLFFRKP